ncbi:uncharacterized protein EMH_0062900 [Eimeria mitis]|uniref:Secreted protein n=1 Tax=Eimeria mitis TaxID=44415 RepID=U6KG66_9EIME|nr:uncharacterized protein EMH_0062900 [Eimeria mitis]CDJ34448.1 hypothetical protein, conserved [Eimeria mitis]
MRGRITLLVLVAFLSADVSLSLLMKRPGGTEPVSVDLAEEGVEVTSPPAVSASRFINLSHNARGRNRSPYCLEDDCAFAVHSAHARKTKAQKLKKKAKKLENKAKELKKLYLQNHTEEEYQVLKYGSLVDALERETAAAAEGEGSEEPQQG